MALPRRGILRRLGAAASALLAGCNTTTDPTPTTTTPQSTTSPPTETTTTATETETTPAAETLEPGLGPLPEKMWPLPARGPANTAYLPDGPQVDAQPEADWQIRPTASPGLDRYTPYLTTPVLADGRLYTVNGFRASPMVTPPQQHLLRAYDPATGEDLWEATLRHEGDGTNDITRPALGTDVVLASIDTQVHAIDTTDGTEAWTQTLDEQVDALYPTPERTLVKAHRSVTALTPGGDHLWTTPVESYPATLAAGSDTLYVSVGRRLLALDPATGDTRWVETLPAVAGGYAVGQLTAVAGGVLALQNSGDLYAYTTQGTQAWHVETAYRSFATDGTRLYAVANGRLDALAIQTGDTVWELACTDRPGCTPDSRFATPVVTDNALYTSTNTRRLLAVRPATGDVRWTHETDTAHETLALDDEALYAVGSDEDPLVRYTGPGTAGSVVD